MSKNNENSYSFKLAKISEKKKQLWYWSNLNIWFSETIVKPSKLRLQTCLLQYTLEIIFLPLITLIYGNCVQWQTLKQELDITKQNYLLEIDVQSVYSQSNIPLPETTNLYRVRSSFIMKRITHWMQTVRNDWCHILTDFIFLTSLNLKSITLK